MIHTRQVRKEWPLMQLQLFSDLESKKEITIPESRCYLAKKVKEAGILPQHVRAHSLRIRGATAYATSPEVGAIKVGFLGVLASCARWSYMNAYIRPSEMAGVKVERETGDMLAMRPRPVSSYAQGNAPKCPYNTTLHITTENGW